MATCCIKEFGLQC